MQSYRSRQWSFQNTFAAIALGACLAVCVAVFTVGGAWTEAPWVAWPSLAILVAALFIPMVIETAPQGVAVRLAGLAVRTVPYEDIVAVERRRYRPMRDFGGWGLRWSLTRGNARAYTTTGDSAVALTLRDGAEVYLGVADEEALVAALEPRTGA
ncbi:hypothetical protein [Demequina sp. NBRC 110057]|uniref:hypothetical protein n=1 Tax=Demequina sp. NBRC 110057 TaxID=1570346 RepID=UPI0009FD0310|nr:hypothetical protein [Demequina sp. NBRC 110057]